MAQRTQIDINVYQGNDMRKTWTITTDGSTPYAFNGATNVKVTFRKSEGSHDVLFSQTLTDGAIGNNWTGGIAVVDLTAANTALLEKDGIYDLQITRSDGKIVTPCWGKVFVRNKIAS